MWEQQSRSYIVIEYNDEVKGPSGISQYVNSLTEASTMELLWIPRHWRIMRNRRQTIWQGWKRDYRSSALNQRWKYFTHKSRSISDCGEENNKELWMKPKGCKEVKTLIEEELSNEWAPAQHAEA